MARTRKAKTSPEVDQKAAQTKRSRVQHFWQQL